MKRLLWADLHNHNGIGYGAGSLDRSYAIARGCLLDAYCFTPHGRWHDVPADDRRLADYHTAGFLGVREKWPLVKAAAEAHYQPGQFVCFHGFEWHSSRHGDSHMIFPGQGDELFAGDSLADLQHFARKRGAVLIPHHPGYRTGWRGADWPAVQCDVSPVVEAFSEHGCSMEPESPAAMLAHSMGGIERSQAVIEQLARGMRVGVVGSTDNHHGHPASYGEGLAGVLADQLTRESVFDALRRRHTYAVSGDRIGISFRSGDAIMGDVLSPAAPRQLHFAIEGLAPLESVRLIKNGRVVYCPPLPVAEGERDGRFVVRLEFGWDAMMSRDVTEWRIRLAVADGQIDSLAPCFAGGAGSAELVNRVVSHGPTEAIVEAFTSRQNSRPTSGLAVRLAGDAATAVDAEVSATYRGQPAGCRLSARIGQLLRRDEWAAISPVFSSPRVRLGQARGISELSTAGQWLDPSPGNNDWYLLRVVQTNGQAGWTSPIWFAAE